MQIVSKVWPQKFLQTGIIRVMSVNRNYGNRGGCWTLGK
jgi:hypothetical protein